MREKFPEPKVDVNGEPVYYDSFADLRDSSHYRLMQSVLRMAGQGRELRAIEKYMNLRIAEEQKG